METSASTDILVYLAENDANSHLLDHLRGKVVSCCVSYDGMPNPMCKFLRALWAKLKFTSFVRYHPPCKALRLLAL